MAAEEPTLAGAKAWLLSKQNGLEYSNKFSESFSLLGFSGETPLKSYLDVIWSDPYRWVLKTPVEWRSKPAYNKLKSAINKLVSDSFYCEKLGADYCKQIAQAMKQAMSDVNINKANAEKLPLEAPEEEFVSDEEIGAASTASLREEPVLGAIFEELRSVESLKKRVEELERDRNEKDKLIRYLQRINKAYFEFMDEKAQRLATALMNASLA